MDAPTASPKAITLAETVLKIVEERSKRSPGAIITYSPEGRALLVEVMAETFDLVGNTMADTLELLVRARLAQRGANDN